MPSLYHTSRMPYIFTLETGHRQTLEDFLLFSPVSNLTVQDRSLLHIPTDVYDKFMALRDSFVALDGKVVTGKIIYMKSLRTITPLDKKFRAMMIGSPGVSAGRASHLTLHFVDNPILAMGLPYPDYVLAVAYEYYEKTKQGTFQELPIAEGMMLRCGSCQPFEEEVNRIISEEESRAKPSEGPPLP
jgi:hypothetical protein